MKKKLGLFLPILLVALLIVLGVWYTRPISIARLAPELDKEQPAQFYAHVEIWHDFGENEHFQLSLEAGDPLYDELRTLLEEVRIKRTIEGFLGNLLWPNTSSGVGMEEGMVNWFLHLDGATFLFQHWGDRFSYSTFRTNGYVNCGIVYENDIVERLNEFFLEHATPQ